MQAQFVFRLPGYDVVDTKLVVNSAEAPMVRAIFQLYTEHRALLPVVAELNARGWQTKAWTIRKGDFTLGLPFNKTNLHRLLTNVVYVGRVRYKDEVCPGEHQGIVTEELWSKVHMQLSTNGATGGAKVRNKHGALLKGSLFCSACNCAMSPKHSTNGNRRYRYHVAPTRRRPA